MKRKNWVLVLVVGFCVLFAGVALFVAWNDYMTLGLMANAEQATITQARFVEGAPSGDIIKVTIKNTGATAVNIQGGYANETKDTNFNSGQVFVIPKETSLEITLTFPNSTLLYGTQCQVKLTTAKGNNLVYLLTYDSKSASQYDPRVDDIIPTPRPLQASELTPKVNLSSFQTMGLCVTSVVATIAVVGACFLANYALKPKDRREFFVLMFFVTLIVVFAIIAVAGSILFPPQPMGLM